eukprot:194068-Chlamydomonas_euryale.AAC.2
MQIAKAVSAWCECPQTSRFEPMQYPCDFLLTTRTHTCMPQATPQTPAPYIEVKGGAGGRARACACLWQATPQRLTGKLP